MPAQPLAAVFWVQGAVAKIYGVGGDDSVAMIMWHKTSKTVAPRPVWVAFALAALLVGQCVAAASANLEPAQRLLLTGKYAEAGEMFRKSLTAADTASPTVESAVESAVGLARCLASEGKTDAAARILADAFSTIKDAGSKKDGEKGAAKARLRAESARLAFECGDYAVAKRHVEAAIKLDGNSLPARLLRAELFRVGGHIDKAQAAYEWLVKFHNDEENDTFGSAESLRWIGLAAARLAEWNRNAEDFKFLVDELYPAAVKLDKDFWPAHYEVGRLFLEKFNRADAAREFSAALAVNPNAAEVHAAVARLALLNRDIKTARASADRALAINPRLPAAWHVKADLLWANFDVEGARRLLAEKALPLNPRHEETLGRLAACYFMLDSTGDSKGNSKGDSKGDSNRADSRLGRMIEAVEARNPRAADFYFQLGDWLDSRHRIEAAGRYYAKAQKLMPQKVGPAAALGMLYMGDGREDEARRLLETAAEADPFNVRTANTLELFRVIDSLETVECDGCILRFDPQRDEILGRYAAEYLAEIYPQLCKQFGYRPPRPALVEIFNAARGQNGHQWFGVRMTGLPYVGTVAACSGRVVAMTSPCDPSIGRRFDWARVLKHELIHVVTLQQTGFNIPHWFTEGLAVHGEDRPRPHKWNVLLCRRLKEDKLYTLDTINFGFTRPGSGADWQMAYCQAELYVDYILELEKGTETERGVSSPLLNAMLDAYAQNRSTRRVIEQTLGVTQEEFEAGFRRYAERVAAEVRGLPGSEPAPPLKELRKRYRENLENKTAGLDVAGLDVAGLDTTAQLAMAYYRRGLKSEAARLAARVNAQAPKHPLAACVLASLALGVSRPDAARHLLENALDSEKPHPLVIDLLAELKIKAAQNGAGKESPAALYAAAARLYQLGNRHEPHNPHWPRRLVRVYLLAKNEPKLTESLSQLAYLDTDNVTVRAKLAILAVKRQDYAGATRWAREAVHIDVLSPTAHRAFAEALAGRHNYRAAIGEFQTAIRLDPANLFLRFELADTYLKAGKAQKARNILDELLRIEPDCPVAGLLLRSLTEEAEKAEQ